MPTTELVLSERVQWEDFQRRFRWNQGEHLTAIAPTGAGKTTLFENLMPYRKYSIMLGTKPEDPLYRSIIRRHGYVRVQSIHEVKPWMDKILLWPKQQGTIELTMRAQKKAFMDALDVIVTHGGWTVWVDECKYISEMLHLRTQLTYCLEQLRSINATVICGAQRPAWLPLSVLSSSSHAFLWKSTYRDDAKRLADIGGVDAKAISAELATLGKHEFLYVHTRGTDARVLRSQVGR